MALASKGCFAKVLDLPGLRVQLRRAFANVRKHIQNKTKVYLHVIEGSPLELIKLLLLESALSGGCPVHVGVWQAETAKDLCKY